MNLLTNSALSPNSWRFWGLVMGASAAVVGACTPLSDCNSTLSCGVEDDEGGEAGATSGGRSSGGRSSGGMGQGGDVPLEGGEPGAGGAEIGGEGGDRGVGGGESAPTPNLELRGPARLRLLRGGSVRVPFEIEREGGFEGPVLVSLDGLPMGVLGDSATLNGAATSSAISLLAAGDAMTGGPFAVRLKATSFDGELSSNIDIDLVVAGKPGSIDTDFGESGGIQLDANAFGGIHIDEEGRTLIAYTLGNRGGTGSAFARYDVAGLLDASFMPAMNGRFGVYSGFAAAKGRVWLGVQNYRQEAGVHGIVVLDSEGAIDEEFANEGFLSFEAAPRLIRERSDGSFYAVTFDDDVVVVDATGQVDGAYVFDYPGCLNFAADGGEDRLIVGCHTEADVQIARVLENGTLDESFADLGELVIPLVSGDSVYNWPSPIDTESGALIVTIRGTSPRLLKFDENGYPDLTFGVQGQLTLPNAHQELRVFPLELGLLVFSRDAQTSVGTFQFFDWQGQVLTNFGEQGVVDISSLGVPEYPGYFTPSPPVVDEARGRLVLGVQNGEYLSKVIRIWL